MRSATPDTPVWDSPRWRVRRDNEWTAGCRWLQSWWRDIVLGLPPGPRDAETPVLVCSTLPLNAPSTASLFDASVVDAIAARLKERHDSGKIDVDRLQRNLLSSQAACFNLFGPFVTDPGGLLGWVASIDPEATAVGSVRFEWAPDRRRHFNGGSAFDAFVSYNAGSSRRFLAVEVKYSEDLAASPIAVRSVYREFTAASPRWRTGATERLDTPGLQQLWLNAVLAESLLERGDDFDAGLSVVVGCDADSSLHHTVQTVRDTLVDADALVRSSSFESLLGSVVGKGTWVEWFRRRYLDFAPVAHLLDCSDPRLG